jgi:beta propeller repeat protein
LNSNSAPQPVTSTTAEDEINPTIDWPWVVYQSRAAAGAGAPWQLFARNLVTSETTPVSPSTQDEIDASVQAGRVVWQDFRDVGQGEIYFKDLESGRELRITTNSFGQYHPDIFNEWIVWQDNRNGEVDVYGYNLLRSSEIRVTSTTENEVEPRLDGPWLVCTEDSLGALTGNLRLVHLPSLRAVPLTRSLTQKTRAALAGNRVVWQETQANQTRIFSTDLPALQAVFQNRNAVAVTPAMANYQQNAFNLLSAWSAQGVQEITRYSSLVPQVVSETASLNGGLPSGDNFALVPGTFLWVKFDDSRVLDLGVNASATVNLASGINVFSYTRFPSQYSAYQLLRQIGLDNARGVRMLDAESGRWAVAEVRNGKLVGNDFAIPNVAVLMLDVTTPVANWKPE